MWLGGLDNLDFIPTPQQIHKGGDVAEALTEAMTESYEDFKAKCRQWLTESELIVLYQNHLYYHQNNKTISQ